MPSRRAMLGLLPLLGMPSVANAFALRPMDADDAVAMRAACPAPPGALRADDATGTCPLCGCAVFGTLGSRKAGDHG